MGTCRSVLRITQRAGVFIVACGILTTVLAVGVGVVFHGLKWINVGKLLPSGEVAAQAVALRMEDHLHIREIENPRPGQPPQTTVQQTEGQLS
jgi:hypothetical protein